MFWCPLTILCLIGLLKNMSSGPSNCGGLGFIWCTHPNTVISLSLKIPSSALSQGISGISNSLSVDHLLTNTSTKHSNKLDTFFFNGLSFHIKPTISTHRFHINKLILIQFYVPFTSTPDHENPFPYTFPRFLLE